MTTLAADKTVVAGQDLGSLHAITDPACALAVYRRALTVDLARVLDRLDLHGIDDLALEIDAGAVPASVLEDAGYPGHVAARLSTDLGDPVRTYAAIAGEARVAVRLDVVVTDACRRFHADYVPLRLLCTQVGPGTRWHRRDRADEVEQLAAGEVAIFEERDALDPPVLLRRSPPIARTGERRLLLVLVRVRRQPLRVRRP